MDRQINLRQIEVFRAVMECRTTTAAAARLNLSQPTVSEHLSALDRATGLTLFERKRNRLIPTATAEAFFAEISRVYLGVEHLSRFVDGLRNQMHGQVHFGTMPMTSYTWMPRIIAEFLEAQQGISISMPVRSSRQILEWVASDQVDFGVAFKIPGYPKVITELLLRVPLVCYFPRESDLAHKKSLRLEDLRDKTIIQLRIFDFWTVSLEKIFESKDRIRPRNLIETYVTQTAAQIAKASRGYALIDLMTAMDMTDETMIWRPVEIDEAFEIHLVYSTDRKLPVVAQTLMDLIRNDARRLTKIIDEKIFDP